VMPPGTDTAKQEHRDVNRRVAQPGLCDVRRGAGCCLEGSRHRDPQKCPCLRPPRLKGRQPRPSDKALVTGCDKPVSPQGATLSRHRRAGWTDSFSVHPSQKTMHHVHAVTALCGCQLQVVLCSSRGAQSL